jgi:phenylacetate-CoA ligase
MPLPKLINTSGNILYPENRKLIETAFGTKIADAYSCEGAPNLFQCNHSSLYHISMEYAITEVLDINDTNAKYGRLITTNLHNYAMPFIRYDTQDFIQKEDVVCGCGRELDVVGKISGRDSDILKAPSGKYLIVHNFTGYFEYLDSIKQFQVRQEAIDFFRILIMVENNFSLSLKTEIELYWKDYIGNDAEVVVNVVESIPLEKSGKRRFLIRDNQIIL